MKIALAAVLLLFGPVAQAGGVCPEIDGGQGALRAVDGDARLVFVRDSVKRDSARARTWSSAWAAGYAVLTLGQLAVVPMLGPADQVDFYVGALSTAVGLAAVVAMPLEVVEDGANFEARTAEAASLAGPCPSLASAERLFLRDAEGEAFGVSWLLHGANVAFNVVVGLVLGLGWGHWESGAINAAAGIVIGEAMILTQPTGVVSDLERYRTGELRPPAQMAWRFGAGRMGQGGFGLRLGASF